MKKLFFLYVFLFMSMQISAQLVIVQTGNVGSSSSVFLNDWGVEDTGDYIFIFKPENTEPEVFSYQGLDQPAFMQEVNVVLNSIISQGYKLIHATTELTVGGPFGYHTYYLAVP